MHATLNRGHDDKQDLASALLLAAIEGHTDVMRCILLKNENIMDEKIVDRGDKSILEQAMVDEFSLLFEV